MKIRTLSQARERGRADGAEAKGVSRADIERTLSATQAEFPLSRELDYAKELVALDRLRVESVPSLARFPETKGQPDFVAERRKGFLEASGGGPLEMAYHYSWRFFLTRRLQTRYFGRRAPRGECTAVFILNSKEGGPLFGRNWDERNRPLPWYMQVPTQGPDHKQRLFVKGVSSGTMCDEEPEDIFPVNPFHILPDDCLHVKDIVAFLTRYADFWDPHNGIIVDRENRAVAYEKLNRRVGWRWSDDGSAAVTACAVVIPEIKEFRDRIHRKSLELRGMDESGPDWHYWQGCEKRYHRLLQLVADASRSGATLWDMANIVTDHAVPYPARVCISGQSCHRDISTDVTEWTMTSRAMVLSGPNRRVLYFRVEGQKACFETKPFLILGRGVKPQPEWLKGTRSDPSLPDPISCAPEEKEMTQDDVFRLYSDVVWREE